MQHKLGKILVVMHATLFVAALVIIACLVWRGPALKEPLISALLVTSRTLVSLSFFAGLAACASRSGKSESIPLAISTVLAFLLTILMCGASYAWAGRSC